MIASHTRRCYNDVKLASRTEDPRTVQLPSSLQKAFNTTLNELGQGPAKSGGSSRGARGGAGEGGRAGPRRGSSRGTQCRARGRGPRTPDGPASVPDPIRPRALDPARATLEDPHDPPGPYTRALRVATRSDADAGRVRRRVGHPA